MKKILFLSSALIMTMCSAFAEDVAPATDKKITGGAGTCTVDVLGVSADGATANTIATWSLNSYDCAAGQYLDETTLLCTECPVGSYCPGGVFTVEANNSKTACPADYTSDAAATAESECYMGCELACSVNMECPPHSNNCTHSEFTTTGKQYVDGACNAYPSVCPVADFACDTGYSKETIVFQNSGEDTNGVVLACGLDGSTDLTTDDTTFGDNGIDDCSVLLPGQSIIKSGTFDMVLVDAVINAYGKDTPGIISYEPSVHYLPNANFENSATGVNMWFRFSKYGTMTSDTADIMGLVEKIDSGNISSEEDIYAYVEKNFSPKVIKLINSIGPENILNSGGHLLLLLLQTMQFVEMDTPWVWLTEIGDDGDENSISNVTGISVVALWTVMVGLYPPADTSVLDNVMPSGVFCKLNTINIDWNPDNGGASTQNMCYYDGTVTLPPDPVKPGYTFTGWKLLEETTTE